MERDKEGDGFLYLRWEETKEGDTVHGARLMIETGPDSRSVPECRCSTGCIIRRRFTPDHRACPPRRPRRHSLVSLHDSLRQAGLPARRGMLDRKEWYFGALARSTCSSLRQSRPSSAIEGVTGWTVITPEESFASLATHPNPMCAARARQHSPSLARRVRMNFRCQGHMALSFALSHDFPPAQAPNFRCFAAQSVKWAVG